MLHFSKSVPMKKQTHLHLAWPEVEYIFSNFHVWMNYSFKVHCWKLLTTATQKCKYTLLIMGTRFTCNFEQAVEHRAFRTAVVPELKYSTKVLEGFWVNYFPVPLKGLHSHRQWVLRSDVSWSTAMPFVCDDQQRKHRGRMSRDWKNGKED